MAAHAEDPAAPAADPVLALVWRHQRQWSAAADSGRRRVERARSWNLVLLVAGALTGALAAQTWLARPAATGSAVVAAVCLAVAGLLQAHALTAGHTLRWTHARAASEALKSETYRYLLRVPPYEGAERAQVLRSRLGVVHTRAAALLVRHQDVPVDDRPLPAVRTLAEYVTARAGHQASWHRERCREHARRARLLRSWQLAATAAGVLLTAVTGFVPSWRLSTWAAAATTVAAAFGAHLAATQHEGIAASYAATADQLESLVAGLDPRTATPAAQARFVADVERVLAVQNRGWTDLLSPEPAAGRAPAAADRAHGS